MKAAVFAGPGRLALEERPEPTIQKPDEVLIEVEACGVCGTDLQILAVPPGHPARVGVILGHEIVGRIAEAGPETSLPMGQRVVVDSNPKCGKCGPCQAGRPANCMRMVGVGEDIDGGLAAYCVIPAASVYRIADHVPAAIAAIVEPLACVLNGVSKLAPKPGEAALIAGAGPIGGMFLKTLRASGVGPIAVSDPRPSRREMAAKLGADLVLDPAGVPLPDALDRAWGGRPEIFVDAVGRALGDGVETVADGGRILLFGMQESARTEVAQFDITRRDISILGSFITRYTFPDAVRMVEREAVDLSDLVTHEVSLADTEKGLDLLRRGEALKVVVWLQES